MIKINEKDIIKQKAEFIFKNSRIIWSNLQDINRQKYITNSLQTLLLFNESLDSLKILCNDLIENDKEINEDYSNYENAMDILFYMSRVINKNVPKNRDLLRNKLREYVKYFPVTKADLQINVKFIKIKTKSKY